MSSFILSHKNVAVVCTVLIAYLVLNSPRTIDMIGCLTTIIAALFVITLNINPDMLVQISVFLISIGSHYYQHNIDD